MKRRFAPWMIWSALSAAVWLAAAWGITGVILPQDSRLHEERDRITREKRKATALVAAAPRILQQRDSLQAEINNALGSLYSADRLPDLLAELRNHARDYGMSEIRIRPDLHSAMSVPVDSRADGDRVAVSDSIAVIFAAEAPFASLGRWLDAIEARPDFARWTVCRIEDDNNDGHIAFSGQAELRIKLPTAADSPTEPRP